MVSIIIPTKNEERFLPVLLESIKKQTYTNYEIIIADAGSTDSTREIAARYGCKVVQGGLPALGRNAGAAAASGELLLFMDADNEMPDKHFLEAFLKEFEKRNLDIAGCSFRIRSRNAAEAFGAKMYDWFLRAMQYVSPRALTVILVKKSLHETIKGFDESIVLGEDYEYARQSAKKGKFRIISSVFYYTDQRRVDTDGLLFLFYWFFVTEFYFTFFGPMRSAFFKRNFTHVPRK
jgi:glycosyltransferase involved in cell wall biosynthesis